VLSGEAVGEEVVGDADGVGDDGQGGISGAAGGEEAGVDDDVEVVEGRPPLRGCAF